MVIGNRVQTTAFTPSFRPAHASTGGSLSVDAFGPSSSNSMEGIYNRFQFTQGRREAVQMAGVGVMMTSMLAGAAMKSAYSPAVMIGGMFAGLAIMASAR